MLNQETYDLMLNVFFVIIFFPLIALFFTKEAHIFYKDTFKFWSDVFKNYGVEEKNKLLPGLLNRIPFELIDPSASVRNIGLSSKFRDLQFIISINLAENVAKSAVVDVDKNIYFSVDINEFDVDDSEDNDYELTFAIS